MTREVGRISDSEGEIYKKSDISTSLPSLTLDELDSITG